MNLWILAILSILPSDAVIRDRAEVCEFNVTASAHSVSIAQVVLWDGVEYSDAIVYRVMDWRGFPAQRSKTGHVSVRWPMVESRGTGGILRWTDSECRRKLRAPQKNTADTIR